MQQGEIPLDHVPDLPAAEDPDLPGPFPVGRWAEGFRDHLRARPKLLLIGEVTNLRRARASTYFELRDATGAAPCAIWNNQLDRLGLPGGALRDGAEIVAGGGPDFYPGSATASPGFSFRVTHLRLAGEGDLLVQLERLRKQLQADGLFLPQKDLPRPLLPKRIGVVSARTSAACADLLAGLERRGWRGEIVWADAPVQDRRAAPLIASALRRLAEAEVEVAVVCRGGGSLTDLWAFCDEGLCRTVALLGMPVVSAIGHESDRVLLDDVAAVSCSTPTHAAETVVGLDVAAARATLRSSASVLNRASARAVRDGAARLARRAKAPARALDVERLRLHQLLRETRASSRRAVTSRREVTGRAGLVIARRGRATSAEVEAAGAHLARAARGIRAAVGRASALRARELAAHGVAVRAHEPQRTLERGYALVTDRGEEPITTATEARATRRLRVRFADDAVDAEVKEGERDEHPG